MRVPADIRNEIKDNLWLEADRLNWASLSSNDKSRYYSVWTEAEGIGGRLGQYMDPRKVRVYIKDTLLKTYARQASADPKRVFRVLGINEDAEIIKTFIKPHGCLLSDGRQIIWSKATEWKAALMALHERAFEQGKPFALVLDETLGKFNDPSKREMVDNAARKIGVERVVWLD